MSRDELSVMDGNKCILQLRGVRPFLSNKYDITQHKRYKELSDYDKKIRMLGSTSEAQSVAHLQSTGLLPSRYEKIAGSPCCMKPDRELAAFCNLNQFYIN